MSFHPAVMLPGQRKMLRRLGSIAAERGFYLAGGTALAIQLGHRRSVDLDWFSASAIEPMTLAADLRDAGVMPGPRQVQNGQELEVFGVVLQTVADSVQLAPLLPSMRSPMWWTSVERR